MSKFLELLKVELRRIFSNGVLVAVFAGAPILYGFMFANVYKKGKLTEMALVVIDEDNTPLSGRIVEALDDNENLQVVKVQYSAGNIAAELPSREYVSVITIPAGFEAGVYQKRYPELQADINMANLVPANFATRALQTVLGTLSAGIEVEGLKKAGMDEATALQRFEPFKISYNRLYNPASNYMELMMPGILGTIMQQVLFLGLALVFARDFEDGYFGRLARVSRWSLYHIALKGVPFALLSIVMWLIVGSFYPLFDIPMPVFTANMAILETLFTLACMFLGMLFSLAIPSQLKSTELLMVLATPSFLLSGYTWPLEAMPRFIQQLASLLPLTHFLQGFRRLAIYRGSLQDIHPQLLHLSIITIVCLVIIVVLLQVKIRRQERAGLAKSLS